MSTDEENVVLGRTVREYRDARKKAALYEAEADRIGRGLEEVGQALRAGAHLVDVGLIEPRAAVEALVDEIVALRVRAKELHAQLESFGFVPGE